MISLLLFDMQIRGVAILILLFLHLAYGKHEQVRRVLPVLVLLVASGCTTAVDGLMGRGPWEEQVLLPATGAQPPTRGTHRAVSSCPGASHTTRAWFIQGTICTIFQTPFNPSHN